MLHFCKSFSDYVSNSIVQSKVKLFLHRYYFNSYSKICLRKVFLNVTKDSFWTLFGTYHNHVPKTELTKVSLPNCKNYFSINFEMFRQIPIRNLKLFFDSKKKDEYSIRKFVFTFDSKISFGTNFRIEIRFLVSDRNCNKNIGFENFI